MDAQDIDPISPAEDFPTLLTCADQSSTSAQRRFLLITALTLALVAGAATMGAIEASWAAWVGAGAFAAALILGALAVTQNLERTWYDGRALAESAKSLTWLYVVRGGPFAETGLDVDDAFRRRLRALSNELRALDFVLSEDGPAITQAMHTLREASLQVRRTHYERSRLGDQIAYYRRRSDEHKRRALWFRMATWTVEILGLAGAILKAVDAINIDVLGVGAACAAALTAWLQTRDHVTLARAYELTAQDLDRVRQDAPPAGGENIWSDYVADAEAAMSREHVMWIARRGRVSALRSTSHPNSMRD